MDEPTLPHDVDTEARLLGAILIADMPTRRKILAGTRATYFFDPWHREVYSAIDRNRDLDGVELLRRVLTPDHRDRWGNPAYWLASLIYDKQAWPVCGLPSKWKLYAADLERLAERRQRILIILDELRELAA